MRGVLLLCSVAIVGCTPEVDIAGSPRSQMQRDVEGYAIASCLAEQTQAQLQDQGDAWASAIVQRAKGDIGALAAIAEQVKKEMADSEMAVIRDEAGPMTAKPLPVAYCIEMIDHPAVHAAIQDAISTLRPAYGQP